MDHESRDSRAQVCVLSQLVIYRHQRSRSPERVPKKESRFVKTFVTMITKFDKQSVPHGQGSLKRKGPIFIQPWSELIFSRVEVRGIVVGSLRIGETGFQISIDDGTGRIACVAWPDEQHKSGVQVPAPESVYNKFVAVSGQLSGFRSEVQIKIETMRVIATTEEPTEEGLWLFEVKEEWEALVAHSRQSIVHRDHEEICPCLCHASSEATCRTLGNPSAWSRSFNRAVVVVTSALKRLSRTQSTSLEISIRDVISWTLSNIDIAPSLTSIKCLPHCAVIEAFNQLIRVGTIRRTAQNVLFLVPSKPEQNLSPVATSAEEPRYPLTPFELTQLSQPVVNAVRSERVTSRPLFRAANGHS